MLKKSFFFSCLLKIVTTMFDSELLLSFKMIPFLGSAEHYIVLSSMLAQKDFPLSFGNKYPFIYGNALRYQSYVLPNYL